jgi:radical SAM protein
MVCLLQTQQITHCPPFAGAGFDEGPKLVFYELTQACDLICRHCRASAQSCPHPEELSMEESKWLIDQLNEFPVPPHLIFTGGDPLKRTDLFQLIEHAVGSGLEVSITPSATPLATSSAILRLKEAGISRIAVSIDGADASTHDRMRGVSGSFKRSEEILYDAHMQGVSTQINTTITPQNYLQISRMAEVFDRLNIDMWSVFFLVPVGRAESLPQLTAEEFEQVFESLWIQSQRRRFAIKTTEAPHYRRFLLQKSKNRLDEGLRSLRPGALGINDGKGVMFIGHTGIVSPSGFLPVNCGQFPKHNVVQIYQDSSVFRELRNTDLLQGKCGSCNFRKICGGSRARAFAVTGNMFDQDPCCSYIPPDMIQQET